MDIKLLIIALTAACLVAQPVSAAGGPATKPPVAAHKITPNEIKTYQHAKGLKETGVMDDATKKAFAADKAACKRPGQGATLDFSDPCNSALIATVF